eukprot:6305885-Pyramimonas_sp.AAC.2
MAPGILDTCQATPGGRVKTEQTLYIASLYRIIHRNARVIIRQGSDNCPYPDGGGVGTWASRSGRGKRGPRGWGHHTHIYPTIRGLMSMQAQTTHKHT